MGKDEGKNVEKEQAPATTSKETETEETIEEILEEEPEKEETKEKEGSGEESPAEKTAEATEEVAPLPEKEEEKPAKEEKREAEEEIVEERTYVIPLSKAWIMPPNKRAPRSMRILRSFIVKHMKLEGRKEVEAEEEEEPAKLTITNEVNERIWSKGIQKPPRNIRVRAAKDKEGNVTVYLAEGD